MTSKSWTPGTKANRFDGAGWTDGQATGPGDTVLITGAGSQPLFYLPGNDPIKFSPDPAPAGYTVSGETIDFRPTGGSRTSPEMTGVPSNTTFAADTGRARRSTPR